MNELKLTRIDQAVAAALPARQRPPFRPAQSRRLCNAQFALPAAPRRPLCRMRKPVLAALRAAELAEWMASGGDYLSSMHQPAD